MTPESCVPGVYVCYEPSPGRSFVGMVATIPWKLGDGTWVTKLVDMEWQYAEFTGKKGEKAYTVFAACLDRCVLVDQPVLIRYRPNSAADQNEWVRRYQNDPLFNNIVNVITGNVLAGEACTDTYRLAVECATQKIRDHFIDRACP